MAASDFASLFIPANPQPLSSGVLNKGMICNQPSTQLPDGAVVDACNYIMTEAGPTRRPVMALYAAEASVMYSPLRDIGVLWSPTGGQQRFVIDNKFLYRVGAGGMERQEWTYEVGKLYNSGAYLIGVNSGAFYTNWSDETNMLYPGDVVVINPTGEKKESLIISSIEATDLILASSAPTATTEYSPVGYSIKRAFRAEYPYFVDWTVCDDKIVLVDFTRPPYSWDGTNLERFSSSIDIVPRCVVFHADRLFFGGYTSGTTDYRQRITWSSITDHTDGVGTNYLDWPYLRGALLRLVGLGRLLVAYFEDGIAIGRPTSVAGDALPFAFEPVETGGNGICGQKAVAKFLDGHFVLLTDNLYYLSTSGLKPVGTAVFRKMMEGELNLKFAQVVVDHSNDQVLVGIPPAGSSQFSKVWAYNFKADAWSYVEAGLTAMSFNRFEDVVMWDTLADEIEPDDWDAGMKKYPSWDAIGGQSKGVLYGGISGRLIYFADGATDFDDVPVTCRLRTRDIDIGQPDIAKTVSWLTVKVNPVPTSNLSFSVFGTTNRGISWKHLGQLTIRSGTAEGSIAFKLTGTTIGLMLESSSAVGKYAIIEIVLRIKARGQGLYREE